MADTALRFAIHDLYAAYASCLDERRYTEWPRFFTEDCIYQIIPRENVEANLPLATLALESRAMLRDRVKGVTETLFHAPYHQRHIIGLPRVVATGETGIRCETNYLVLRTRRNELSEVFNTGRYVDLIARTPEGLRFAEKRCVFDSEMIPNSIIYPL